MKLMILTILFETVSCQVSSQLWKRVDISDTTWRDNFFKTSRQVSKDKFGLMSCASLCQKTENCDVFMFDEAAGHCVTGEQSQTPVLNTDEENIPVFVKADKIGQV